MKRIEIRTCDSCLHSDLTGQYCKEVKRFITGLNKNTGFPDWCPLPDVEEPKIEKQKPVCPKAYRCIDQKFMDCPENVMCPL